MCVCVVYYMTTVIVIYMSVVFNKLHIFTKKFTVM